MTNLATEKTDATGEYLILDGEQYYRIGNSDAMPDFFMSIVGASDHWMFISSRGALTAGRCDPDSALFPYAADDQISVAQSTTGPVTIIRDELDQHLWEPFSGRDTTDQIRQNLYKNPLGNKLVLEEINETRQLAFRYRWAFSERFGFVRSCHLGNLGESSRSLKLLDGLRNVLPYGVSSEFMMRFSNLANAYKKSERLAGSGLGLFYLSSIPTDRAEPSEGLRTTVVWQAGLSADTTLLSTERLSHFCLGGDLETEDDVRGKPGAFLVSHTLELAPGESLRWHVVAELAQDHADVAELDHWLQHASDIEKELLADVEQGQQDLLRIVSSSDAIQCGANRPRANRHLSNTVFNVMRGGIPLEDYRVHVDEFRQHLAGFNQPVSQRYQSWFDELPATIDATELRNLTAATDDPDLRRLGLEYLPLAFSRRHGDPTRPWNRFAIQLRSPGGRTNLNYQGNWRDIFQNWEALALSFPQFSMSMIGRFLNATTADGYNPYRVTKDGFEWEEPTPGDPWANIGYWGDHQVIYLLKLLEWNRKVDPKGIHALLNAPCFVHANVPYRIKNFEDIKRDPQSTIVFDAKLAARIAERVAAVGSDGKLLTNQAGEIHRITLFEKLLTISLAKLSNFVPDGGIWLNTQRPEWNDANNALVGNGLSMVTTCYLHRWFCFLQDWLSESKEDALQVSTEVAEFFHEITSILSRQVDTLDAKPDPYRRLQIVEQLSRAGCDYRSRLYEEGPSGKTTEVSRQDALRFFDLAQQHLEATIRNNRREDGLFHAYNLLDLKEDRLEIEYLYEMLEGQVAVLSAGLLSAKEVNQVLEALRESALYRANQDSYILYPDRQLPRFLEKNQISREFIESNSLLKLLLANEDQSVVRRDEQGVVHFHGDFRNTADLKSALEALAEEYQAAIEADGDALAQGFEDLFGHRQFTGRSGTFFGYEGLGSIYWHMVSKLGLAIAENIFQAVEDGADAVEVAALVKHFQDVRRGIGAEKSPRDYGAFPSDPYSHTPENAGVKQPGMTGQVKEDILSRFMELGVNIVCGCLEFRLDLFDRSELLTDSRSFEFQNLKGETEQVGVPDDGFAFTLFQIPIIYRSGPVNKIQIKFANGDQQWIDGNRIDRMNSRKLFARSGEIVGLECEFADLV